eukprot:3434611-Pleurochrysis_carterae.AAC.1
MTSPGRDSSAKVAPNDSVSSDVCRKTSIEASLHCAGEHLAREASTQVLLYLCMDEDAGLPTTLDRDAAEYGRFHTGLSTVICRAPVAVAALAVLAAAAAKATAASIADARIACR